MVNSLPDLSHFIWHILSCLPSMSSATFQCVMIEATQLKVNQKSRVKLHSNVFSICKPTKVYSRYNLWKLLVEDFAINEAWQVKEGNKDCTNTRSRKLRTLCIDYSLLLQPQHTAFQIYFTWPQKNRHNIFKYL